MFDLLQHPTLVVGVLDLLHPDHLGLLEHLDGIEALVVLGLDEVHTAEAAGAEGSLDLEVAEGVLAFGLARLGGGLRRGGGAVGELLRRLLVGGGIGVVGGVDQVLDAGDIV